jgi:hypothetical protein
VTRISLDDDITNRQLERGAIYCGRFSLDFQPSLHDDRRIPKDDLFIWTPPGRERHLDGGVFLKLNDVCNQLTGLDRYVPLIIFLMVETGLRLEELCAVRWRDVALDKRRMEIAKLRWPKEHEARTIVLSVSADVAKEAGLDPVEVTKQEITSTTRRPRRVGWFEWDQFRKACVLNAPTDIVLTFADYIDGENQHARRFEQLTENTIKFIEELERVSQAPVSLINTRFMRDEDRTVDLRSIIDRRNWITQRKKPS